MDTPVQKIGGKSRRTRKLNTWAKAAGEYYREHKSEFKSFSEVLSSPKLKEYYDAKYKNKKGGEGNIIENITNTNNLTGGKKKRKNTTKKGGNKEIEITKTGLYGGETTAPDTTTVSADGLNGSAPIAPASNVPVETIDPNATTSPPPSDTTFGGKKARKSAKKSKK